MKFELAIIGLVSLTLLFFIPVDALSNKSISVGGHIFTAKLDDNWTSNPANVMNYDPKKYFTDGRELEKIICPRCEFTNPDPVPEYAIDWIGSQARGAFTYKTKQSSESIAKYGLTKYGFVNIRVLRLTQDYIEAYSPSPNDTLHHAILPICMGDETDIVFNGKPAMKCKDWSGIAILLDNSTIALIDVWMDNIKGMQAWDIIDSITVD
jgi:hypothetical protein